MVKSFIKVTCAFFLLANAVVGGEANSLSPEEKAAGWKLLFDGTTTAGWRALGGAEFPAKGWVVEDGTLHRKSAGGGDIVTKGEFENFEFTWEWKIGVGANSGIKYNLVDASKNLGFEYQLLDDQRHPDGIKGGPSHQTGALYDLIAPAPERKVNPVGEWNQSRLLVDGNLVEHWLNGVKIVTYRMGSDELKAIISRSKFKGVANFAMKKKSPLLVQDHNDEVTVRNLKLRELPAKP